MMADALRLPFEDYLRAPAQVLASMFIIRFVDYGVNIMLACVAGQVHWVSEPTVPTALYKSERIIS
jgi:hypothetical protein